MLRDEAIAIGIEQVQYMRAIAGTIHRTFEKQVRDWGEEMGSLPEKITGDDVTYWFAEIWMHRLTQAENGDNG